MVFSLLINSNGKKSSVLLDSILTHLYATTKFLKIWVSENPISSHLVQSEVTSSTLIPNVTRRLYIRFVNSISTPAEMKKRWSLFSTHIQLFFLAVCILWNGMVECYHVLEFWMETYCTFAYKRADTGLHDFLSRFQKKWSHACQVLRQA